MKQKMWKPRRLPQNINCTIVKLSFTNREPSVAADSSLFLSIADNIFDDCINNP